MNWDLANMTSIFSLSVPNAGVILQRWELYTNAANRTVYTSTYTKTVQLKYH